MNKRGLPDNVRMKHDLHYVEELMHNEDGEVIGRLIPIDQIRPNPDQPRMNIGDLSELKASIREKGLLEPLIVRPHGDGFQLIAGERRWRACKELGIDKVPCIERDVDDREMLELALIENLQRKDLTAFEESEGLQVLGDKFGYTHAQIGQVIGKSRTSVTESLALHHMPDEIKEMCRRADIDSKSLLLQVVRQPSADDMKRLIERIARQQLTRDDIREETPRKRSKPFVFNAKGKGYHLSIHFNKTEVSQEEIEQVLKTALDSLK